ncbi:glycosyltransferase (plasmid) [Tundrisphaera lichenicola]|uniref:glycosyltransferase n=1 Tax=Tundrisphaera lichenicola TaxID=2029860 RepID=UPI003EB736F3
MSAGDLRLFRVLTLLANRHSVDLHVTVPIGESDFDRQVEAFRQIGVRLVGAVPGGSLERVSIRRRYHIGLFEFWEYAEWAAGVFRERQPWARVIIDTVDIHFLREEAGLAHGFSDAAGVEARKLRELATYRQADAIIAITPEDRKSLEFLDGMPRQYMVPIIVPSRPRDDRPRGREALFIGGFRHAPNVDGILWFVGEVWPEVRRALPDATLTVVGSHAPVEVKDLGQVGGVQVVGHVPETAPYLDNAALSVAPLRYGAGMKGKVTEAMASGMAVVTTTVGAQGLGAVSGQHLAIADDAGEFARQVVGLLGDPNRAREMGQAARELVGSICSPQAAGERLEEMLAEVVVHGLSPIPPPEWLARSVLDRIRQMGRAMLPKGARRMTVRQ